MHGPHHGSTGFTALAPEWQECVRQAWDAFRAGSLPIGAVVVDATGEIVARGRNCIAEKHLHSPHLPGTPYQTGTPLAHAEMNALLEMGERSRP